MSSTYTATRDTIIAGALRLVKGLAQDETPTAGQITEAADALNLMLKGWQGIGDQLSARKFYALTHNTAGRWVFAESAPSLSTLQTYYKSDLQSTDYVYVPIGRPLQIYNMFARDNINGTQYEVNLIPNKDFQSLNQTATAAGEPNQYTLYNYNTFSVLQAFPRPSADTIANKSVIMWYKRPIEDLLTSSDIPDFPSEWHEAIKYGLAVRLAAEYSLNPNDRMALKQDFNFIYSEALNANNEGTSLYFQPELRNR